ncbi:fructose bisphosphate aldolase [Modestobacter sp. NPDC049651]|uniref:fructose bisphosphate aldolase n=1 Tax=unclassified Modestobacter TaxID=2643866 RepID=UPI0033D14CC3
MDQGQQQRIATGQGFFAALDQSGGSTPGALRLYGVRDDEWSGDAEMFDLVHRMRERVLTSPVFDGRRVLGVILFEQTMERQVDGLPAARYLAERKGIVPFLKVDRGLAADADGVQLMKPIEDLDALLASATAHGVFGTKMRSVVHLADPGGVAELLDQQFEVGARIAGAGLVPILEPEVEITSPERAEADRLLLDGLLARLDDVPAPVLLKLSLPAVDGSWTPLVEDPRVLRVLALSGGYARAEAVERLARNPGVIASFSRALLEGLAAQQPAAEFDRTLDGAVEAIYRASLT